MTRPTAVLVIGAALVWWAPTIVLGIGAWAAGVVWSWAGIVRANWMIRRGEALMDADRLDEAEVLLDQAMTLLDQLDPKHRGSA